MALLSARMPITVGLLKLSQGFFHSRQTGLTVHFREAQALQPDLLFAIGPGPEVLLVELVLVVQVKPLDQGNFLVRKRGNPAHNLPVAPAFLKTPHTIQPRDSPSRSPP